MLVSCPGAKLLACGIDLDERRLRALDPSADVDAIRMHLASIERICRGGPGSGPIGALPVRARFHWLTAPRSSIIQMSPAHTGRTDDAAGIVEHLLNRMVRISTLP